MKKNYVKILFLALFSYGNAQVTNWTCNTAEIISSFPFEKAVDASASPDDGFILNCTGGMNDGIWYSFTGNGKDVTINVTNVSTDWDPEIGVYTGFCEALTCVKYADNAYANGQSEQLKIAAIDGITYRVNIGSYHHSANKPEGLFKLTVTTGTLSTASFDNNAFKSYPNPVKDILHLSYNAKISNVSIFNLLGQQVLTKTINANEAKIDLSHLPNGTYTVKVTAGNELKTIKVVKQ